MQRWTLRGAEEVLQFLEGLLGTFFLQEMAAVETASPVTVEVAFALRVARASHAGRTVPFAPQRA